MENRTLPLRGRSHKREPCFLIGQVPPDLWAAAPTTVPTVPLPNVTNVEGGVAIKHGDTFIGTIGVSGAPGGAIDEDCVRTAMAKIADRIRQPLS